MTDRVGRLRGYSVVMSFASQRILSPAYDSIPAIEHSIALLLLPVDCSISCDCAQCDLPVPLIVSVVRFLCEQGGRVDLQYVI